MDPSKLFGNQSDAFSDYANQMRAISGGFQPWISRGNQAGDLFFNQSSQLTQNPNFLQDMITKGFYESPYQKLVQDLVTKRMNFNAANTGMLGSGAANRALQDELTASTGQFLNDYIGRGMNSYGMGFQGLGNVNQMGLGALGDQAGYLEQAGAADLKGQQSKDAWLTKLLGTIGGGAAGYLSGGGFSGALKGAIGGMTNSNPRKATLDLGGGV